MKGREGLNEKMKKRETDRKKRETERKKETNRQKERKRERKKERKKEREKGTSAFKFIQRVFTLQIRST